MIKFFYQFWTKSIARQLMLGIALVHAVLMTIFVLDLVSRERGFMLRQHLEATKGLAHTLATNGTSWILANDYVGIEEVIKSQAKFPNLKYAMFTTMQGKVLGFTDRNQVNRFVSDEISLTLRENKGQDVILINNKQFVDVAVPIMVSDKQIGWARVGITRNHINENLQIVTKNGVVYIIIAIIVGLVFAYFMARGMTLDMRKLMNTILRIKNGDDNIPVKLSRVDEIGNLSREVDIMATTISQREREILRSNNDLQKFTYTASHELKEPIQDINRALSEIVKNCSDKLDTASMESIKYIINSTETMQSVIDDLLIYSQDSGEGEEKDINCNILIAKLLSPLSDQIKKSGLEIEVGTLPIIKYNEFGLSSVFRNLITNAINFRTKHNPRLNIIAKQITNDYEHKQKYGIDNGWLFIFTDNGIGFKQEDSERIFQLFERLDNNDSSPGRGIGLAICNKIIIANGGKIWAESEPGNGATFYFTIPDAR